MKINFSHKIFKEEIFFKINQERSIPNGIEFIIRGMAKSHFFLMLTQKLSALKFVREIKNLYKYRSFFPAISGVFFNKFFLLRKGDLGMYDISEVYKSKLFKSAVELQKESHIVDLLMLFKIQGTLLEFLGFVKNELGTEIFESPITSPLAEIIVRVAKYDDENGPFVSFLRSIK